ncbi:unnamed protein product [Urochloa humidicola]
MLGGGGGASTIRDLLDLAEPGWSPPPPYQSGGGGGGVPDGSPFAASYVPPPQTPPQTLCLSRRLLAALRKRTCNPEISVGLFAAVAEPASARLRVAGPVSAGASGIMAAVVAADLVFCNGTSGGDARRVVDEVLVACKLCRLRLDDRTIYLYMDKGFCNPECRYKYFTEELYEQRRKLAAEARATKTARRHGKATCMWRRRIGASGSASSSSPMRQRLRVIRLKLLHRFRRVYAVIKAARCKRSVSQ